MKHCCGNDPIRPWRKNGKTLSELVCVTVIIAVHYLYCFVLTTMPLFDHRCVNYGVLPHDEAARLFKVVTARKKKLRLSGGAVAASPKKKRSKPKLVKEEAADPDMQISGAERVGSAVL